MHKNNTLYFISLVDEVLSNESNYFKALENDKKTKGYPYTQKKILDDCNVPYLANTHNDNQKLFSEHITQLILSYKDIFTVNTNILFDIAKQIHIDYLLDIEKSKKAHIYYSLAETIRYYGIYRDEKIVSLTNKIFWVELIKKLYLLNLINPNGFYSDMNEDYTKDAPNLANAIKFFNDNTKINLKCIDNKIVFQSKQEEKILSVIEKKLQQVNIFEFIDFILIQKRNNKTIPFNYIINIALKNIHKSNFKKSDQKTFIAILNFFKYFISLYKLQSYNQWEYVFIDKIDIEKKLKKQILYSSLYTLSYPLHVTTVTSYINNLLGSSIINKEFEEKFNFSKNELNNFLVQTAEYENKQNIIKVDLKLFKHLEHIFNFFSIESKDINTNYTVPLNNYKSKKLFVHNPIVKHKGEYYIIGFKFFKMYFYNALVEKIRLSVDSKITTKIGNNIDIYVEKMFEKNDFDVYAGKYRLSKKSGTFECDLVIKLQDTIIFIENKNKALTKNAFSGSSIHILQDFIKAFATSQFQLLRHEKHLIDKKVLTFQNGKTLHYDNERIVKISLSPNNWYETMNNIPKNIILALIYIRFSFKSNAKKEDIEEFEKTNKELEKLTKIVIQLDDKNNYDLENMLHNSLFIPLELISENHCDTNLINSLLGLITMKYGTSNIYDAYNKSKKHKSVQKK